MRKMRKKILKKLKKTPVKAEKIISLEKDQKRRTKDLRLQRTYGITLKEWEFKVSLNSGKCEICNKKTRLNQDHRHVKGYKKLSSTDKKKECRGAICFLCNKFTIGGIEAHKNPRNILQALFKYCSIYKLKGDDDDFRPYFQPRANV